jgi:hypothetical protein
LRSDFYNNLPVEGDEATADKEGLSLKFVGNDGMRSTDHFWGLAKPSFGIRVAESAGTGYCRRQD